MFEDLRPVIAFRMSDRLLLTGMVIVVALLAALVAEAKTGGSCHQSEGEELDILRGEILFLKVFEHLRMSKLQGRNRYI